MSNQFNATKFIMSVDSPQKLGWSRAEVAFVGRSNVGKSSMLNALCAHNKLAKVSNTPGRTRAINIFEVADGKWLVDLPGYGFAAVHKKEKRSWPHMIEYYICERPDLKVVYVIVDAYVGVMKLDFQMMDWLTSENIPFIVIANKIDRIAVPKLEEKKNELAQKLEIPQEDIIWVSAEKGFGMNELRSSVAEMLGL